MPRPPIVPAGSTPLRAYLNEMGKTPLLDRREEMRLARRLLEARVAITRLADALPAECRRVVLVGDAAGLPSGSAWPLEQLEAFVAALVQYEAGRPGTSAAAALVEILAHKRALDEARSGIVVANLRLVVHVAKKYASGGLPLQDRIQEGNLGLLKAVERFEHGRGNKFSTYAYWWIKQTIERGIAEKAKTIRIPSHVDVTVRNVGLAARDLTRLLSRTPTGPEIAAELRMPVEAVDDALAIVREPVPLEFTGPDGATFDAARILPDERTPSPFDCASQEEVRRHVDSALKTLAPREEAILRMRFGIGRDRSRTLEEIGKGLRLSRERVRQIESLALAKIGRSPRLQRPARFRRRATG